ncbi:amidohydrolase [Gluconacetobacter johannae DSM 13595]|uniref:Amidohydrolase family protein n=1 Tax=Gluconacetobacter johannae TaxID=112140 RepID=A0A7W4J6L5_9PROT|nr:amidohydrolase family protein [Gluconacetobacter johannae]MBB2175581.1 amidohydrolase family protein [Gluconacetobacter johannae]GBQ85889.1 amidohydrolase [Gluconacetobacter johannae DSM 13595]
MNGIGWAGGLGFLALLAVTGGGARAAGCTMTAGGPETVIEAVILTDTADPRPGRVVVDARGMIACVGATCQARMAHPRVIRCPADSLSPGLINPHDHIAYTGDAPRPDTGERFVHRHDWRKGLEGHAMRDPAPDHDPEVIAWGELRFLISGITAMVGGDMAPGLVRNMDFGTGLDGLPMRPVTYRIFPLDDASGVMRTRDCNYGPHPADPADVASSTAFLAHVAEGTGDAARNEFRCLSSTTYDRVPQPGGGGVSQDLMQPNMTILHGVGLTTANLETVRRQGGAIVWSPRSNLSLYGRTLDVMTARRMGIPLALGTDWLPSGSMNMSREFACAMRYNRRHLGAALSARDLWRMATGGGARAVHAETMLGAIAPGHVADLALFRPAGDDPFDAVVRGRPAAIDMVMRGGRILYGDAALVAGLDLPGCEALDVTGQRKALCIRTDQPFAFAMLRADMARKRLYPVVADGTPPDEPPCDTLDDTAARTRP